MVYREDVRFGGRLTAEHFDKLSSEYNDECIALNGRLRIQNAKNSLITQSGGTVFQLHRLLT